MTKLDAKFWKTFALKIWEKKPLHIKDVESPLRDLDAGVVFELLVKFADVCRKRQDAEGFKFYVDGTLLHPDEVLDLLPEPKDGSLQGYHERMHEIFEDYGLVCDELLQVSQDYRGRLIAFTKQLYAHVGFPNRFAEMGLYLGNYKKTPFGVHVDGCGVFSFPVAGTKSFRVWDNAYGIKHPDLDRAFSYKKHLSASKVMTAEAGDMTYWPSSAWHIAESRGDFSATWSLGVWVDRPHANVVQDILGRVVKQALGTSAESGTTRIKSFPSKAGDVGDLPPLYEKTLFALKNLDAKVIEQALRASWLAHLSAQGLKTSPSTLSRLGATARLKHPESPILWQVQGQTLNYAYAGQVFAVTHRKVLQKLIQDLNAGHSIALKSLGPAARRVLQDLGNAGAF